MVATRPVFSIIVPTYNRKDKLMDCLKTCIDQDFPKNEYEIIVVDDGSSDGTEELVSEIGSGAVDIRYFRHEKNLGVSEGRNTGIRASSADFISMVADDYLLPRDYLKKAQLFFAEQETAQIMISRIVYTGNNPVIRASQLRYEYWINRTFGVSKRGSLFKKFYFEKRQYLKYFMNVSGAAVVRKAIFDEFGTFKSGLDVGEDLEFGIRVGKKGIPVYLNPEIHVEHVDRSSLSEMAKRKFEYGAAMFSVKKYYPDQVLISPRSYLHLIRTILYTFTFNFRVCMSSDRVSSILLLPIVLAFSLSFTFGMFHGAMKYRG